MIGRSVRLNPARGETLEDGSYVGGAEHNRRAVSVVSRGAGESVAGMDSQMHPADIAPVVQRDTGMFLVLERQFEGVPVEIRKGLRVRADEENGCHTVDQHIASFRSGSFRRVFS